MKNIIQSLWIGPRLSKLEQLSIASFLHHGHEFDLYTYGDVEGIPSGTNVRDAEEILPSSRIFLYRENRSYAGFSNYFRYRLLFQKGGWWVDTDVVCLSPFQFSGAHVFATEANDSGKDVITAGIIKAPSGSEALKFAWERCNGFDPSELRWGDAGSKLLIETVRKFGMEEFVMPSRCFCPISYVSWEEALRPEAVWEFGADTRAVHLWNEMWRRAGRDKDADYPQDCLYERLKAKYLLGRNLMTHSCANVANG